MGALHAIELAESFELSLEDQIRLHLTSNHYPPVPKEMVPVCIEAIDKANDGDWESLVELPEETYWRGKSSAPVYAIIESHHLEFGIIESELD